MLTLRLPNITRRAVFLESDKKANTLSSGDVFRAAGRSSISRGHVFIRENGDSERMDAIEL